MSTRELHEGAVRRWHVLAAILTVMTMRRAMHRFAALHRLLRRGRSAAVKCIRREGDSEYGPKDSRNRTHHILA